MNNKLYLVSCDSQKVFTKFVDMIQSRVPTVKYKDYDVVKFRTINKLYNNSLSPYNKADIKLVDSLSKIIECKNDIILARLVSYIDSITSVRIYTFIRVKDLHQLNKLKRMYKRPNYKTLRIDNTEDITNKLQTAYHKYKFDSKIQYDSDKLLRDQVKGFIHKHLPTLKRIHN